MTRPSFIIDIFLWLSVVGSFRDAARTVKVDILSSCDDSVDDHQNTTWAVLNGQS